MGKRTVKNYPSPRLMETIGATNQSVPEAIGELVANCFDARVDDLPLEIIVDLRSGKVAVTDNGRGMTDDILEKAVCIAEDMSKHIERGKGAKGHFGMGFKTSCSTLGRYYEIYTRPIGGNVELHVAFDISEYGKRPSGADAWDIVIEDYPTADSGPLAGYGHGTSFVISSLKDKHITVSAVLAHLGEAFKAHLEMGDKITLIDDFGEYPAVPKEYDFIEGTKIEIDTACGPDGSLRITGWVAIDKQLHNDGLYGFNIYRNKQLIEKWDKSWFRAHLMTSRIIGEANLDFLNATFYKQGLQQDETWAIVNAHMKEFLKGITSASSKVSKQGNINKPAELNKIIGELRDYYNEPPIELPRSDGSGEAKQSKKKPSVKDAIKTVVSEKSLILSTGEEIAIKYIEQAEGGEKKGPFDYIYDKYDETAELQVLVFNDHPLWSKKIDTESIKIVAISDAIYRALVETLNIPANEARFIRNKWIWDRTSKEVNNG